MTRSRRIRSFLAAALVIAGGLTAGGVASAPPAAACDSDCGEIVIFGQMFPQQASYGERITTQGVVKDDSVNCFFTGLCNWPLGDVDWYNGGERLGHSNLRVIPQEHEGDPLDSSEFGPMYADHLDAGDYVLRLQYVPGNFNSESEYFNVHISQALSSVELTQAAPTSEAGVPAMFTATVTGIYNGSSEHPHHFANPPGGTIEFFDGGTVVNIVNVVNGVASAQLVLDGANDHQLTARFSGDVNYEGSLAYPIHHVLTKAVVNNSLVLMPDVSTLAGQDVTFTSTVTAASAANTLVPTGDVTFTDTTTGTTLGTVPVDSNGVASLTRGLSAGTHTITSSYGGDQNFDAATAYVTHDVDKGSVTNQLTQSAASTVYGEPFGLTSTIGVVEPAGGQPTGSVTFTDRSAKGATLGTDTLFGRTQPSITTAALDVGSHTLTSTYNGDGNFNSQTSGPITHLVNKGNVTVVADQSKETTVFGEPFNLNTAVVALAPAAGTPTGMVTFTDTSTGSPLGSLPLDSAGHASLPATLGVGSHLVTVSYSGDGHFNSGAGTVSHLVDKAATTAVLSSPTADPSTLGDAVTFIVNVAAKSPGAGTPTGTVEFRDAGRRLGATVAIADGVASIVAPSMPGGVHNVTASYSGDDSFLGGTSAILGHTIRCDRTATGTLNNYTAPQNGTTRVCRTLRLPVRSPFPPEHASPSWTRP